MPYSSLHDYYWNSGIERPIVVVDWKVYARDIESIIKKHLENFTLTNQEMRNYMKAIWAFKLNRGCDCLNLHENSIGFTSIIVDDVKGRMKSEVGDRGLGYWRNHVSFSEGLPIYKGGREPKDEIMMLALETGEEYLSYTTNFFFFSQEYFEADDFAGLICRLKREGCAKNKALYLSTVDGDWQVLVSDEDKITWCNTKSFNDRIRGNKEVISYYERKEGVILDHPSQVSQLKVYVGDRGDNLLKGSPLRLFDLLEEDSEYQIDEFTKKRLKAAMNSDIKSNNPEHLQKAISYLLDRGLKIPVVQNPTEDSYYLWEYNIKAKRKYPLTFAEQADKFTREQARNLERSTKAA